MTVAVAIGNIGRARSQFSALLARLIGEAPADQDQLERGRIVLGALKFCEQSCDLASEAMQRGCWLHEMVLVRPVLEATVRILFATRVPDGWRRYFRYWAEQDREWAIAAREKFPADPSFGDWQIDADARIAALPVKSMNYKLNNALQAIIDTEREAMRSAGQDGAVPDEKGDVVHLMLFKLAHHVTHGSPQYLVDNMDAQVNGVEFRTSAGMLFAHAAYLMTRAVYFFRGWPNREADAMAFLLKTERPS